MSPGPSAARCPECGTPLPAGVRTEFCPVCMVRDASQPEGPGTFLPDSMRQLGDYDLLGEIARGGMGVVFRARQRSLGRVVALKLMLGGQFASPDARERFRREAAAAARIQHPNIVAIHEIGEHEGQPYFSMDYIEGRTLGDRVRSGPLPAREAARYVARVAMAVEYAHQQGVLHRDLKPSNVLIDLFDEPRVTDFGLAKQIHGSATLTASGEVLGSPAYAAPEQVRGESTRVGLTTDVYSLGALMYHLVTGRPPFQADSLQAVLRQVADDDPVAPRRLNPSVPADLETVCLRCLEKDPLRRYPTAGAVAEDLERFLAGEPVRARPLGWAGRMVRWAARRPAVAGLLGALGLAVGGLVVGGGVAAVRIVRAEQAAVRNLRQSLLVQASALRLAGGPGQQRGSLSAVDQALALGTTGPLREQAVREVIAASAHSDLEFQPIDAPPRPLSARMHPVGPEPRWRQVSATGTIVDLAPDAVPQSDATWEVGMAGGRLGDTAADGATQVVVGEDSLEVWHLGGGDRATRLLDVTPVPQHHALSPDGRWLVTAGSGPELVWHDLVGGGVHPVDSGQAGWRWLGFSPDGRVLGTSRLYANSVDLYRTEDRALDVRLPEPGPVDRVAWAPDGARFAGATADGRVFYQDVPSRNRILSFTFSPARPLGMTFDPKGRLLASAWDDRTIRLWDVQGGRLLVAGPGDAEALGFRGDGSAFGPVSWRGRTGWYQVVPPVGFTEILAGYLGSSELQVGFSPDDRFIVGRYQNGVRVFDPVRRDLIASLVTEWPRGFAFPTAGPGVAVLDRQGLGFWGWGAEGDLAERMSILPGEAGFSAVAASTKPAGWWLLGLGGEILRVGADGSGEGRLGLHPGADALEVDVSGRWLATVVSATGTVRVWSVSTGAQVYEVQAGPQAGVAFDREGRRMAVWGSGFRLVSTEDWEPVPLPLAEPRPLLGAAAFSPDGRHLAVAADVYDVLVLDLAGERGEVRIEPPSRLRILALAWDARGQRLGVATAQGKLRVWDFPALRGVLRQRGLPDVLGPAE